MNQGTRIINEVIRYINEVRSDYIGITDNTLYDNGGIFYMNGNDGTEFDWICNQRCCEFYLFDKSTQMGFIKVYVNDNDTLTGYMYLEEGNGEPIKLPTKNLLKGDALYIASVLYREADKKGIYDDNINKINLDIELSECEMLNYNDYDDDEDE